MFEKKKKEKEKEKEKQYFQNLFIKFSNGKMVQASVPAFCFTEADLEGLSIAEIKITTPKIMPPGMSFELVKNEEK